MLNRRRDRLALARSYQASVVRAPNDGKASSRPPEPAKAPAPAPGPQEGKRTRFRDPVGDLIRPGEGQ